MFEVLYAAAAGFDFGSLFSQLDSLGFFRYILPFLLLFSIVYVLLSRIDMFKENRGAAVLISFAIGLLALQMNFVPEFFQNVFPKFGIGVSLLLIALILAGAFITNLDNKETYKWIFFGLGSLIFIVITILSLSSPNFPNSYWWDRYGALTVVTLIIVVGIILVMVLSKKDK